MNWLCHLGKALTFLDLRKDEALPEMPFIPPHPPPTGFSWLASSEPAKESKVHFLAWLILVENKMFYFPAAPRKTSQLGFWGVGRTRGVTFAPASPTCPHLFWAGQA